MGCVVELALLGREGRVYNSAVYGFTDNNTGIVRKTGISTYDICIMPYKTPRLKPRCTVVPYWEISQFLRNRMLCSVFLPMYFVIEQSLRMHTLVYHILIRQTSSAVSSTV